MDLAHVLEISNGISVNSKPVVKNKPQFIKIANKINDIIKLQGAWFFQLKKDSNNELTLLEIATRLGGSSSLFRGRGVNFALLSIFDAFNISIQILENDYEIEIDRALDIKYKLKLEFSTVYVDFDDCLVINDKINSKLITFLYQAFDNNKKIILISKHDGELESLLKKFRVDTLFDEVIHISKEGKKYKYIHGKDGIFIDDSFSERKEISDNIGMPVFSPDMIEVLNA